MMRPGRLFGALLLVSAATACAPARAEDIPFVRALIASSGPAGPCGKAFGDFDGDGRLDALVAGSEGPLVGYAAPGWTASTLAAEGYATEGGLAVGDLDRDGDLDVTVGAVWFENPRPAAPATGAWPLHRIGPGDSAREVAVGDLDQDGQPEIVLRGESGSKVTLWKQNKPRSWTRRDLDPGAGTRGLALADLDRDGRLDVVVGGRWLRNPGGKILTRPWPRQSFGSWNREASLAVGDLNQDGRPDVVMTVAEGPGRISWFENPKNARQARWRERVLDGGPLDSAPGVSVADLDRDGDLDVVASEFRGEGRLLLYLNEGQAAGAGWSRQVLGTPALHDVRVADVGNDGDGDILGTLPFGSGPVELWENRVEPPAVEARVLVFSKTAGFRHTSIEPGIAAIRGLGAAHHFAVDATEDAGPFTAANLGRYQAVVFLSTTGDVLNNAQQAAFMAYVRNGGGFVGIHAAADTEYGWPWYGDLLGARFARHPAPAQARLQVEDRNHPSTQTLPDPWSRFDEWYDFQQNPRSTGVTVLLRLDEASYPGGQMGSDHPIAWYHEYAGGRAWYTGGGHTDASFSEPDFLEHLLGGIRWATGLELP